MIHFRSSLDKSENRVIFSPRPGTSQGAKEIQRQLVYGYQCQFCRNPILFAFLTPEKISLKRYEETRVVNGLKEFHMIIPGPHSDIETAYHIDWIPIPGQSMGLQRVYLKNHIIPEELIGKDTAAHQGGPRCCPYVGVHSTRKDILIKDVILMGGFPERELAEYELPGWTIFLDLIRAGNREFLQHGIGDNPVIGVRSDWIDERKGLTHWRGLLLPYKKSTLAAAEAVVEAQTEQDALAAQALETSEESVEQSNDGNYISIGECIASGQHGESVDDDGFCNACGESAMGDDEDEVEAE